MYRLLGKTSFKVNGANFSIIEFPQPSTLTCSFCNKESDFFSRTSFPQKLFNRNLTTTELHTLRIAGKKKRKARKPKKYAELVEVKQDSSNVTKAVVKKLNANLITQLAEKPELSLDYLSELIDKSNVDSFLSHKRRKNSDSQKSNVNATNSNDDTKFLHETNLYKMNYETLEKTIEKEIEWELIQRNKENVEMLRNSDLPLNDPNKNCEPVNSVKNDTMKIYSKKPKEKAGSQEKKFLINNFNSNLSSYIDLCVNCDYLNVGFSTLNHYVLRTKKNHKVFTLKNPHPFNTLMHGYAKKGNFDKIQELFRLMKCCGVSATPQTFAAGFEAIARLPEDGNEMKLLQNWYKEFTLKGFKFQNLFHDCSYLADQRELVLKSIHQLDPSFVPHYNAPYLHYTCPLVNQLNEENAKFFRSPSEGLISEEEITNMIQEQIKTELLSPVKIKSVFQPSEITDEIKFSRKKLNDLQNMWRMSIREALVRDLQTLKLQQNSTKLCHTINIYPYLKALTIEENVDIILHEVQNLIEGSETFSKTIKHLRTDLGHQVRMKYQIKHKQQHGILNKVEKIYKDYCKWYLCPETDPNSKNARQAWQRLLHKYETVGPSLDEKELLWPSNIVEQVGKFLYNIIIKDIKMDVNFLRKNSAPQYLPVFYSLFRYQGHKLIEEIKPHPQLIRLFKNTHSDDLNFNANILPMVSPPVPWISSKTGGYIVAKVDFLRLQYGISTDVVDNVPPQKMYPVLDSLNQLASIPWKVNEKILDILLEVFRNGGSAKLNVPQPPSKCMLPVEFTSKNAENGFSYKQRLIVLKKKNEMYGLWCEALYRLSLADHYRNRIFWLPHNLDFRGRTYPVPPHLTHLGSDMARSLLHFAKGERLGPKGLDWLKIHCINLTSLKKRSSLKERLMYADEILDNILDSAEKPLTGKMWWAESEEPWQTLACCIEIKAAIDSEDPENYVSQFPIHQDGSCNGLQHYAALGRDQAGAVSVNLLPSETPQDVYACVVNLVEEQRVKDAEAGVEIAKALEGFIKRKVIKQTVMTTVYGVTKYGARLQIVKQLKDIENFPQPLVWLAAGYLTLKTFYCLQKMFTSSREIQNWLNGCAKFIAKTTGNKVEWETPLGLPVVQPYVKTKLSNLLSDGSGAINKMSLDVVLKPNLIKQENAFPPNFVHSLDSTHMMLTSLFCEREGITFVSVHDCFWTHASSVDVMNKICRENFVNLHSNSVLENLSDYLMQKFSHGYDIPRNDGCELPHKVLLKVPKKGEFDLKKVLQSVYFFS